MPTRPLVSACLWLVSSLLVACGKSAPAPEPEPVDHSQQAAVVQHERVGSAKYVGADACTDCHRAQYDSWRGSHHDLAMQPANRESMLGDFRDGRLEHFGVVTRFFRRGEEYWVETDNAQGKPEAFKIEYAFGAYPLQQYLIAFPDGRYQARRPYIMQSACSAFVSETMTRHSNI